MRVPDLESWYRNPGNVTGDDLYNAAIALGFTLRRRTSGSHFVMTLDGWPGHLSIPIHVKGNGTKRSIIRDLIEVRETRND